MNPVDYFGVLVLILDSYWFFLQRSPMFRALEYDIIMRSKQSFLSFSYSNRVLVWSLIDLRNGCSR